MSYLGRPGATAPLTSADIPDDSITAAKIASGAITAADVAADMATQAELDLKAPLASPVLVTPNLGTPSAVTLTNATFPAGHVLQVKSTTIVAMYSSNSSSFADITGLSVAITPSSSSNKILVFASLQFGTNSASGYPVFRMLRDSTEINSGTVVGSRISGILLSNIYSNDAGSGLMMNTHFLDSPATTSATTYKIQGKQSGGNWLYVGQSGNDPDGTNSVRSASTITVMEVVV